jgi:hypothetical protein
MSRRTDFVYAWCEVRIAELLRKIQAFWDVTPCCWFPTFRRNVMPSYWGSSSHQVLSSLTWEDCNTPMFASCVSLIAEMKIAGIRVWGMTMIWAYSEMLKRNAYGWSSGRQLETQWELWGARKRISDPSCGTFHAFDRYSRFKAWWLLYVPKGLTFRNSVFFPHSEFLYSFWSQNEQLLFPCTALSD